MAKKIEIIDNAIVITDTISTDIELDMPKRDCYFVNHELIAGVIKLYDTNGVNAGGSLVFTVATADSQDSGAVTFTESTFRTFARTNLGA